MQSDPLSAWRREHAEEIVGESDAIRGALDIIRHVATADCTVLVTGETGTGKELFARAVHRASSRRGKPFVAVNCAAIPDTLLETELFGHIRGAFTGATNARAGKFMAANGGTLFLDEIGDLTLPAQAKLLRVLEARVITPVGSDTEVDVDVRIVAATHRNLEAMVAEGTFRADLYFRLGVVPIELPPLRDRGEDIDAIADLCVARANQRTGRRVEGFDDGARAVLRAGSWPGNIREVAHVIERAVVLVGRGLITAKDLHMLKTPVARGTASHRIPDVAAASLPKIADDISLDLRAALENLERTLIDRALTKAGGNRTEAAALLGLNRTTLVEKLRKYATV